MKLFRLLGKIAAAVGILLLVYIAYELITFKIELEQNGKNYDAYNAYIPESHPYSKWVCQEGDIFFISDSNGVSYGYTVTSDGPKPFSITFDVRSLIFKVAERDEQGEYVDFRFGGDVHFFETGCTLIYSGEEDDLHFFGDRTGEVNLTFTWEDLPIHRLEASRAVYATYGPPAFPGSKWICKEEKIYFTAASRGLSIGHVVTPEGATPFRICFGTLSPFFFLREFSTDDGISRYLFDGEAHYCEENCILIYSAKYDEEHLFGDKTGEVTLTFTKEGVPPVGTEENLAAYMAFSPRSFPSTKWVCQEKDLFFISDRDGISRGYVETPDGPKYFSITFGANSLRFAVDEFIYGVKYEWLDGTIMDGLGLNHLFSGDVVYSEEGCTLTYSADDDKSKLFGDQIGQVTLTFIKEPLSAYEMSRDYPEFFDFMPAPGF